MISLFPEFTKLTRAHQASIDARIYAPLPSSDFTFLGRWTWNLHEHTFVSLLNDNVVFQMNDYTNNNVIYTFSGMQHGAETIKTLLSFTATQNIFDLTLIPENVLGEIDKTKLEPYEVTEERDQFDYIYDLEDTIKMEGSKYAKKRYKYNKFVRENIFTLHTLDLTDIKIQNALIHLFEKWAVQKKDHDTEDYNRELEVLKKCFPVCHLVPLITTGVYINEELVGFNITEKVNKNHSLIHFQKTDIKFAGMSEFLFIHTCRLALGSGATFINRMQDLGVEGLRKAKEAWHPRVYLKKYRITYKQNDNGVH